MLAKVCSAAVNGIEAYPVEVEVNAGWGDTLVVIVGLPDAAVKESRDRVSTALTNSGYKFPMGRTTINLAPADVKKEGPSFDLPIAVGMLAASEQFISDQLENFVIVGELALTGAVRPVRLRYRSVNSESTLATVPFRPPVPMIRIGMSFVSTMYRMRSWARMPAMHFQIGCSIWESYTSREIVSVVGA